MPSPGSESSTASRAGSEASAERRPPWERSAGEPGETGEGTPSDQVTLEDSEKKQAAAAASDASTAEASANSEEAVLEDAVDAMKRKAAEPSLDEASAAAGEPPGDMGEGTAGQAGASAPGSLEDIQQAVGGGGAGEASGGSEAERLNAELNASLGRFDGAMLGERERVQARAESTGSGASQAESAAMLDPEAPGGSEDAEGNYGSVREGPAPQGGKEGGGASTENDSSSGSGMSTIGGGKGREGDYTHAAATNTPPPDIPDGSDDDVVARQIREAAMKEKDPELRDKLWDEYRKYVNSAKRKS